VTTPTQRPRDESGIAVFAAAFAIAGGGALLLAVTKAAQGQVSDSIIAAIIAIACLLLVVPAHRWATAPGPTGRRAINHEKD
jgi:hypothetical protein